mgnify:CR=1 FL=1
MFASKFPVDLQKQVETAIVTGKLQRGNQFDIQTLCEQYIVDCIEFKKVIESQVRKGLAAYADDRMIQILGLPSAAVDSVFQYAQKFKLKPRTVVRDVSMKSADIELATKLQISKGSDVFVQVRTRLVDEQVLANQYNFIPFEICPGLEGIDLSHRSFQVTLEEDYHTVITRFEETYSICKPSRDDCRILDIGVDAAVLRVERTSFSRNEYPLVYADIHVNPTQFHYVSDLWPQAVKLVASLT